VILVDVMGQKKTAGGSGGFVFGSLCSLSVSRTHPAKSRIAKEECKKEEGLNFVHGFV
jgi:hypothetical protein